MNYLDLNKAKQGKTAANQPTVIPMKKELLRQDLNPWHTAYKAKAIATELPGRVKSRQYKGNQFNLT